MAHKNKPLQNIIEQHQYVRASPKDKIRDVVCLMPQHYCSAAAVLDDNGKLIGIMTERDVIQKALAQRKNIDETTVEEVMTRDPLTVDLNDPLSEPLEIMTENNIRTVPILDNGEIVGIVDIRDLYQALHKTLKEEIAFKNSLVDYVYDSGYGAGYKRRG